MSSRRTLLLVIGFAALVPVVSVGLYLAEHARSSGSEYAPGSYSSTPGPYLPNGKTNFARAAFRFLYVIGFGMDGYEVTSAGDLVNIKVASSGDIGCRMDAIAVNRSGDWLYLGCTRTNMGRDYQSSILPCRILKTGWIKPALQLRVAAPGKPVSMTVDHAGTFMYVGTPRGIAQYALGEDGKARPIPVCQPVGNTIAGDVVVSSNRRFAYATNYTQNRIYQFSIQSNGALKSLNPPFIATGAGPMEGRCDPLGRFIWCLDGKAQTIDRFDVHSDGTLTRLSAAAVKLGRQASSLAITPDAAFAYVARYRYNSILQFRILRDGTFKVNDPISAPGAGSPSVIRVAPGGKFAMALNWLDGMLSLYSINSQGTLDAADPSVALCSHDAHEIVFTPRDDPEKPR